MSILFFYLPIFPNEKVHICCWVVMAGVSVASILFNLLQLIQCVHVDTI